MRERERELGGKTESICKAIAKDQVKEPEK